MNRRDERGSTLLLYPAGVLVVFLLAAIAVDLSMVHHARRELVSTAGSAADDAAAMIDEQSVRSGGAISINQRAARSHVVQALQSARLAGELSGEPTVTINSADNSVTVTAEVAVPTLFSPLVPGGAKTRVVTVETRSVARENP